MVYFTPKKGKRKGLFHRNSHLLKGFCQRSPEDEKCLPQRGGDQVQKAAEEGAEKEKIPPSPQGQGGQGVEPDLAVLPKGGGEEEGQAGCQPEEEVQEAAKGPEGEEDPGKAEKVVEKPQGPSQGQTEEEGLDLEKGREGQTHPRKRRARKLPPRGSSSS